MLKSLFNKVAGLKPCNFIKKELQHMYFPVNIAKFLRTAFFYRTALVTASVRKQNKMVTKWKPLQIIFYFY